MALTTPTANAFDEEYGIDTISTASSTIGMAPDSPALNDLETDEYDKVTITVRRAPTTAPSKPVIGDYDDDAIAMTTSTNAAPITSSAPLDDEYDSDTIVVADMRQMPIVPRVRKIFDQLPLNFSRSADGLNTFSFDDEDSDPPWTGFTLPISLQLEVPQFSSLRNVPVVTPYTLLNPSADPITKLPQELLLHTFGFLGLSDETVLVSATQEEAGGWTCRLEAEKDIKQSKKQKRLVAKAKKPTQHALLRDVSKVFRDAADEAHRTQALFSFVVHQLPELRKKQLILHPTPMAQLDLTQIRHAEIEVPFLVETQSAFTGGMSLHTRSAIFVFHTRPEPKVECTKSPLPGNSFLSEQSRIMAEGVVEIVEKKGLRLLKEAAGGRGWVMEMMVLMGLGMDLSERYCGFGGKREWLRVQGEKIEQMKAELPVEEGDASEEGEGS